MDPKIAIFLLPVDLVFILYLINHIFYPESVLFTHEQVTRALNAYPKIEEAFKQSPDWGLVHIKEYLDSIPEEVKKQLTS